MQPKGKKHVLYTIKVFITLQQKVTGGVTTSPPPPTTCSHVPCSQSIGKKRYAVHKAWFYGLGCIAYTSDRNLMPLKPVSIRGPVFANMMNTVTMAIIFLNRSYTRLYLEN